MSRLKIAGLSLGMAAMLALTAQPAMARQGTRSGDSLPGRAYVATKSIGASARQPAFFGNPRLPNQGWFGGLIFPLPLPPRLIDRLEDFFERAGIENPAICRIFDFSFCDDNDSPG